MAGSTKILGHAAAVVRAMADEVRTSSAGLAALLRQWFVKATLKGGAPEIPLNALTQVIALAGAQAGLSDAASKL